MASTPSSSIGGVISRMETVLDGLAPDDARRHFHEAYLRSTRAVAEQIASGGFADPPWVERWDVAFAGLYLDAFDAWARGAAPQAWQVPFSIARDRPDLPALRQLLFGINVHINFDLPQALLAAITHEEFGDPEIRELRERDHHRIDQVLQSRITAEDRLIPDRSLADRLLAPLNHRATGRFLTESRAKVWRNALVLSAARRSGPEALAARITELNELAAQRVADLAAPGLVVLRLARTGFGVLLSGA